MHLQKHYSDTKGKPKLLVIYRRKDKSDQAMRIEESSSSVSSLFSRLEAFKRSKRGSPHEERGSRQLHDRLRKFFVFSQTVQVVQNGNATLQKSGTRDYYHFRLDPFHMADVCPVVLHKV